MARGYYGTDDNPLAELHSERKVITPQTSGGGLEEGRYRLRTDLDSGDRIATYEINVGNGIEEAPVFPVSMSTDSAIQKYRQTYVPGEGWGFVPVADEDNYHVTYPQLQLYHDPSGSWYGWHDAAAAVPNSAIHQWKYSEGSGDTFADSIGNADGTRNGFTWVSGTWVGNNAADYNGSDDYGDVGTLGSFGSSISSDFAVAITVETTDDGSFNNIVGGVQNSGDGTRLFLRNRDSGQLNINMRDQNDNVISVYATPSIWDGDKHRLVFNKTANSASGLEIWVDGSEESTTTATDESFSSTSNFDRSFTFAAQNDQSTPRNYGNVVQDNAIIFNDSLTSQEVTDDYNAQPWS